jgi:uncharacterized protein YqhQ
MKAESAELRLPAYGGQAVIEGVLMRGKRARLWQCVILKA